MAPSWPRGGPVVAPARARYQVSELAGRALAVLYAIMGMAYLLLRLWG